MIKPNVREFRELVGKDIHPFRRGGWFRSRHDAGNGAKSEGGCREVI